MAGKSTDQYANMASIEIVESAANTLTYKKLETGVALFEKVAWIIHRIEYFMDINAALYNATGDVLGVALCAANSITSILDDAAFANPILIDIALITRVDLGAAASGFFELKPLVKDFSSLPGGGLIVPPAPLYGAAQGVGLTGATTSLLKIFYTIKDLSPDDYWQLVEARRTLSA